MTGEGGGQHASPDVVGSTTVGVGLVVGLYFCGGRQLLQVLGRGGWWVLAVVLAHVAFECGAVVGAVPVGAVAFPLSAGLAIGLPAFSVLACVVGGVLLLGGAVGVGFGSWLHAEMVPQDYGCCQGVVVCRSPDLLPYSGVLASAERWCRERSAASRAAKRGAKRLTPLRRISEAEGTIAQQTGEDPTGSRSAAV